MKVKDIIERVTILYNDKDYIRIGQQRYLQFLDDAINQLILSRPDAHVKTDIVKLNVGTRQEIPSDGYSLIDIYMNKTKNADGTFSNGSPVYQVARKDLDYFNNWQGTAFDLGYINEFAYDMRTPRTFWVSPYVGDKDVYVEIDYSHGVPEYAKSLDDFYVVLAEEIPLEDVYRTAIINYVLYLLYSTDSTSSNDRVIAQRYESSFYQALGLEYKAALIVVPKIDEGTITGIGASNNG